MNVTELARKLHINTKKLLEILPEFGFDIGAKAIKVDDRIASQIMKSWNRIRRTLEAREEKELQKQKELEKQLRQEKGETVKIPHKITVNNLAEILSMPTTKLIMELMKNGILATKNEFIDHDTAVLIAEDLGFTVELEEKQVKDNTNEHVEDLKNRLSEEGTVKRPPVIVVVGHVDHGKTKLLDAIRKSDVVSDEVGGITQHIGAYQVVWKDPKTNVNSPITFIDTPGHEAFTVMRSRGAKVADIAILVVAADDSVKPQTIESINIIKAAKIPLVVAINKIDKEGVDVEKVKIDLSQNGIVCEEWGGKVPMVEISAKQVINIDKLLDMLLLISELNVDKIKANPNMPAAGTVIEAHVDQGQGNVASVLVQTGTLRVNDPLVINGEIYGKVRAMKNDRGEDLKTAPPSTPVKILGFKVAPQVGDILDVAKAQTASKINVKDKKTQQSHAERAVVTNQTDEDEENKKAMLNLIIKADTLGSQEAVIASLAKIEHAEVGVRIVGKGLGNVNADDVAKAKASNALICAFNVTVPHNVQDMIKEKELHFIEHKIIYDLLDQVKSNLGELLHAETVKVELGKIKIKALFRSKKGKIIAGGLVVSGKIETDCKVRVLREEEEIGEGKIAKLQIGKQNEKIVHEGTECGLQFEGKAKLKAGDILEAYKEEIKVKKLEL